MQMKRMSVILSILFLSTTAGILPACNPKEEKEVSAEPKTDSLKLSQERGKYLVTNVAVCIDCHSTRDMSVFSGPVIHGSEGKGGEKFGAELGLPGEIYAKNITPAALKDWTDGEIIRAITEGVNKDGDTLFPLMPYMAYSRLPKQDVLDIVAYIRTLTPIENQVPARKLFIPISAAVPPLPPVDLEKNPVPDPSDPVKYGAYLFTAASCSDCHTPREKGAPDFTRLVAGGNKFSYEGFTVISPNITPDSATGIGSWTEENFLQKFKQNAERAAKGEIPGKANSVMPWTYYAGMKESDLKAIYAFLRTVKPIQNKVDKWPKS